MGVIFTPMQSERTNELLFEETDRELFERFLAMNWLRPENAVWDTMAAILLRSELQNRQRRLDIGCGNGLTTFLVSGGEMSPDYDWYINVTTAGFSEGADIYNAFFYTDISKHVARRPRITWDAGVDHKQPLLDQAQQLGLYRTLNRIDLDEAPGDLDGSYDLIFSNMLYWLRHPFAVLTRASEMLAAGGRMIVDLPNPRFYQYCESYSHRQNSSRFLKILNRGRGDTLMWTMEIRQLAQGLTERRIPLRIVRAQSYLSKRTLSYWDFGLRPFSPALIRHTQKLDPGDRLELKSSWCATVSDLFYEMFLLEKESLEEDQGGFWFIVLERCS